MLEQPITTLKGIGDSRAQALQKLDICTVRDAVYHLPRGYQDFSTLQTVANTQHGECCALRLRVLQAPKQIRPKPGFVVVMAPAQDDTGRIQLTWYYQPYRNSQVHAEDEAIYAGRVDNSRGLKLLNPSIFHTLPGILPVYPLTQGLSQQQMRNMTRHALDAALDEIAETLPQPFLEENGLCGVHEALRNIHFPPSRQALEQARHRLAFEDMLYYLLTIALLKRERQAREGIAFQTEHILAQCVANMRFEPTHAQMRVLREIEADMQNHQPMNRLVQGDVGSGKTILAFFALEVAAANGYQGVLMAPTELLAQQHFQQLRLRFGDQICLLSGGMKPTERAAAYKSIANGEARMVVGTHALLQERLQFHKLGVVVTDEQHRFGVRQRAAIANKGDRQPDVLVMSATPIPRTLAMLLYGDLDLSVLDEMPPGRRPVLTRLVPQEKRTDMYRFIQERAQMGESAYVVCPLVERSEMLDARSAQDVYEELCAMLPSLRIALLHGRMAAAKKEEAIELFRRGETDVLVSTTVVEVGVDVPHATVMVIENADRFGLAQLHQLRGRVGRGGKQSFCFLLSADELGDAANERLSTMTKTNDGFVIAQKDLEIRGPGEFLGTRQHGDDEAQATRFAQNMDVLFEVQRVVEGMMQQERPDEDDRRIVARAKEIYEAKFRDIANN